MKEILTIHFPPKYRDKLATGDLTDKDIKRLVTQNTDRSLSWKAADINRSPTCVTIAAVDDATHKKVAIHIEGQL